MKELGLNALKMAEMHFKVFPLKPRGKTPITTDGFKSATSDKATILKWWNRNPDANIGISIQRDRIVVDIDSDDGVAVLAANDNHLPATVTAKTPRGTHFWFRLPLGFEAQPKVGIFPGVDLRAVGSYVVAPPSVSEHGIVYEWTVQPNANSFADAPDWLLAAAKRNLPGESSASNQNKIDAIAVLKGVAEGGRDQALFRYASKLRAQGFNRTEAEILILSAASNCNPPFPKNEALRKVDQAWKYKVPEKPVTQEEKDNSYRVWTAKEFLTEDFAPPRWFVDNILPEGITLVSSKAKTGKSYIVGGIALSVAHGGTALGRLKAHKSGVLYLDLEQEAGGAQERWNNMLNGDPYPDALRLAFKWPRMGNGCIRRLNKVLDENDDIGMVVVDVLTKIWPLGKKFGANAYHEEYEIMSRLHDLAATRNISIILIHHDNKGDATDPLDRASGSAAMTAASDVIWSLSRGRAKAEGNLLVTGKRVEEAFYKLRWKPPVGWAIEEKVIK